MPESLKVERRRTMRGMGNSISIRKSWISGAVVVATLAVLGLTPQLWADDPPAQGARAVRLSSVDGQVQLSLGGQTTATEAVANAPLFEGTRVVTGEDGRAEVQFEDGSVARLSPNSSFTITMLRGRGSSGEAEIALETGLGYFELQGGGQSGAMRVKFGDSVVTVGGFTVLRINMDNPPGELAVFSGNAHIERGDAMTVDLHGGESVTLKAKEPSQYTVSENIEPDSWDSWNADRDQELTALAATKTGATNMYSDSSNPAWSDLDANGNWYNVPGEGNIWSPYEASDPGWDPYGDGNWTWAPGFGYVWASGNSWGYTPYSCGMWNWYGGFGWGWAPGAGGCSPWWFGGVYGVNVGTGPGGWRAPFPPRPPHRVPGPGPGRPVGPERNYPVIAVNRHIMPQGTSLPARDRMTAVEIAGVKVAPMHPLSARPQYGHTATGYVNHVIVTNGTGPTQALNGHLTATPGIRPGTPLVAGRSTSSAAHSTAASHPAASASHVSSGGWWRRRPRQLWWWRFGP